MKDFDWGLAFAITAMAILFVLVGIPFLIVCGRAAWTWALS